MIRRVAPAILAILAALSLAACSIGGTDSTQVTPPPPPTPAATNHPPTLHDNALLHGLNANAYQIRETLAALPVKPAQSMNGFDESLFPLSRRASDYQWPASDFTRRGCSSTMATLERDGVEVGVDGCDVITGTWVDPYTGATVDRASVVASFPVSLQEVWRSGGSEWNAEQRAIFANSSISLVAASEANVEAKGTSGADTWGPSWSQAQCAYAVRYVMIKSTYGLNLTSQQEKDNLALMLGNCGDFGSGELGNSLTRTQVVWAEHMMDGRD